jgi:hypothetical protein
MIKERMRKKRRKRMMKMKTLELIRIQMTRRRKKKRKRKKKGMKIVPIGKAIKERVVQNRKISRSPDMIEMPRTI